MAKIISGKDVAAEIRGEIKVETEKLIADTGVTPGLVTILVGENPASVSYVTAKQKASKELGFHSIQDSQPADISEEDLLALVEKYNQAPEIHGILVQLPLPAGIDEHRIIEALYPRKDVDGFHPENAGRLLTGLPGFVPCTPAGIVELLKRNDIALSGRRAVIIGRSNIVGKPMAVLLLRENCTVTVCHSRTVDLPQVAATADILIAAVGRMGMVTRDFIKPGAAVVDVGIHRVEDEETCRRLFGDDEARLAAVREKGGTLVGDVHPLEARDTAGWLTPVPGGVGPLTIAMLLKNTLDAAERSVD